jgi:predicted lipoprotein
MEESVCEHLKMGPCLAKTRAENILMWHRQKRTKIK